MKEIPEHISKRHVPVTLIVVVLAILSMVSYHEYTKHAEVMAQINYVNEMNAQLENYSKEELQIQQSLNEALEQEGFFRRHFFSDATQVKQLRTRSEIINQDIQNTRIALCEAQHNTGCSPTKPHHSWIGWLVFSIVGFLGAIFILVWHVLSIVWIIGAL